MVQDPVVKLYLSQQLTPAAEVEITCEHISKYTINLGLIKDLKAPSHG